MGNRSQWLPFVCFFFSLPLFYYCIMANEMQMMALQEWAGKRGHEDGRGDGEKWGGMEKREGGGGCVYLAPDLDFRSLSHANQAVYNSPTF